MRFGLFGSAQARRPGPRRGNDRQQPGLPRVDREQCRGRGARLSQHLCRRAPFHRLRAGLGQPQPVDLARRAHLDLAPRHRRAGPAVAQPGPAGRAGRDPRPAVRRTARFRRRQGLSLERVRRASASRWRRPTRASTRRWTSSPNPSSATSRSATAANTGNTTTSSSSRPRATRPHPPFWMGAGSERSVRQVAERGYNLLLGQYDLAEDVDPARRAVQGGCRDARPPLRPDGGRRRPRDPFRRHARRNWKPPRSAASRAMSGSTICRAAPTATTATASPREDEAEVRRLCDETAIFGTPDDIARKLETLRDGGVEYVLINFGGSRENIRRFAREIMPAFADAPRDKRARDGQAMAVAAK